MRCPIHWLCCVAATLSVAAAAHTPPRLHLTGNVSVGTFNAYLYRGTAHFRERKDLLIQFLQGDKRDNELPDILCLQEVFRRSEIKDIVEAVKDSNYPYHVSFEDLEEGPSVQPACEGGNAQAEAFYDCLQRCSSKPGSMLNWCSISECGTIRGKLTHTCISCLVLEKNSHEDSEVDTLTRCTSSIPANEYAVPYGVLLLSQYPLSKPVTRDYLSTPVPADTIHSAIPRGYVAAEVDGYTFLCTHLQAYYDESPYVGPSQFQSYEEQQTSSIKVLIKDTIGKTNDAILLGDFNHGPPLPRLEATFPRNYRLLTSHGYSSTTVLWLGHCTYCGYSNLLLRGEGQPDYILDHTYLHRSKLAGIVSVSQMFDSVYTSGAMALSLSDHYGVRTILDFTKMDQHFCPSDFAEYSRYLLSPVGQDLVCPA